VVLLLLANMFDRLVKIVEGIYSIFSSLGKLIWLAISSFWHILLITGSLLVTFAPYLEQVIDYLNNNLTAAWEVLGDSTTALDSARTAGWPAELATGLQFANSWVPLAEWFGMFAALMLLWFVCTMIRIVKSFIPAIN